MSGGPFRGPNMEPTIWWALASHVKTCLAGSPRKGYTWSCLSGGLAAQLWTCISKTRAWAKRGAAYLAVLVGPSADLLIWRARAAARAWACLSGGPAQGSNMESLVGRTLAAHVWTCSSSRHRGPRAWTTCEAAGLAADACARSHRSHGVVAMEDQLSTRSATADGRNFAS